MLSLNDFLTIYKENPTEENWRLFLNNFLDDFKRAPCITRLVEVDAGCEEKNIILAGLVEWLVDGYELSSYPKWIFKKEYYGAEPIFPGNPSGELRFLNALESPHQFKKRNVYISKDAFVRV